MHALTTSDLDPRSTVAGHRRDQRRSTSSAASARCRSSAAPAASSTCGRVLRGAVGDRGRRPRRRGGARGHAAGGADAGSTRDGGGAPTTYAAVRGVLDATPEARADRLALLVAIGVALVALTHLFAWLAGQMGRRRAEVAGLRAAGIAPGRRPPRLRRRGGRPGRRSCWWPPRSLRPPPPRPLLGPMRLVGGWAVAPLIDLAVRPWLLAAVVLGVAVVTAVCCAVGVHPLRPRRPPRRPAVGRPMTRLRWLLATSLRGLASRTVLSLGSLLLTVIAIASAVVGPSYQLNAANSFVIAQLARPAPDQHRSHLRLPPRRPGGRRRRDRDRPRRDRPRVRVRRTTRATRSCGTSCRRPPSPGRRSRSVPRLVSVPGACTHVDAGGAVPDCAG